MTNLMTLTGNLTSDPELRFTQAGTPVANVTVAYTPRKRDPLTDEWVDGESMFLRCSVWGEQAENVAESLSKGDRVIVAGSLRSHSWRTGEGEERTSLEMAVDEIGPALRWAVSRPERVDHRGKDRQAPSRRPQRR